jgi:hypothetical protein
MPLRQVQGRPTFTSTSSPKTAVRVCIPVTRLKEATAPIRGLQMLNGWVRLKIPRISLKLLETVIADA